MGKPAFSSKSPRSAAAVIRQAVLTESMWTVNDRLANAERELTVQFTRIAQLQAQLDVVIGTLRRATR